MSRSLFPLGDQGNVMWSSLTLSRVVRDHIPIILAKSWKACMYVVFQKQGSVALAAGKAHLQHRVVDLALRWYVS